MQEASILVSIKKMLGLDRNYTDFDTELIIFINSAFSNLNLLAVGIESGFSITGYDEEWPSFSDDEVLVGMVKSYIYDKVRMSFDPPSSQFVMSALDNQAKELEWKMNVYAENLRGGH